jgi:DNA-binding transcriptional LysR family regulator
MNIHHLELFYFIGTHGGITEAARRMPYGIQQPAISAQILRLEEDLGVKLFQRRPFQLTPAGRELYEFAAPFFSRVAETSARLRGDTAQRLRLAALDIILRNHLPTLLVRHRRRFPHLKLRLYDANQAMAEELLKKQEIDLAITELEGKPAMGIRSETLLQVPLVLLVPENHSAKSAREILKRTASEPLIALPENEALTKLFRRGLATQDLVWPTSIETGSLDLVAPYVAAGFGVAAGVLAPGDRAPAKTRALPLRGFPKLVVAALWTGKLPPIAESFLELLRAEAHALNDS